MKYILITVMLVLTCSASAGGKLAHRKAQVAVLKTLERVGLLEASIQIKMDRLPSMKTIKHNNVMVDVVQAALLQLERHEDLTPLEALRQQRAGSGWKSSGGIFGFFSSSSIESKRATTVDVLIDLLENKRKVARFLATLPDDLVPPIDGLDLTSK